MDTHGSCTCANGPQMATTRRKQTRNLRHNKRCCVTMAIRSIAMRIACLSVVFLFFLGAIMNGSLDEMGKMSTEKMSPAMSQEEVSFFRKELSQADAYLEFGVGGSTALASTFPNLHCYKGIESSKEWIEKVSNTKTIAKAIQQGIAELKHVDIGDTQALGMPANNSTFALWPKYSDEGFAKCHSQAKHLLVLVDGRFRVACFLKVLLAMDQEHASKTHMLIHDYGRKDYHAIEEFADLIEIHGSLALFKKKSDADQKALKEATLKFEHTAY